MAYTDAIGTMQMPASARRDLESGQWLFGRGVADMKCGVATATAVLEDLARDPSPLRSNVAVLFVPDEENSSLGMLGAARPCSAWCPRIPSSPEFSIQSHCPRFTSRFSVPIGPEWSFTVEASLPGLH